MPDLITPEAAQAILTNLSPAQVLALPQTIAAASSMIRLHCGRRLTRGPSDEILTPPQRGPALLAEYPINDIARVGTDPTIALTITNDDPAGFLATASCPRTAPGSNAGQAIALARTVNGVKVTTVVTFASLTTPTIAGLAAAINATPGGWTAEAAGGFEGWPTSEIVAGDGAQGAAGRPAAFSVYAGSADYELDPDAGTIDVAAEQADPFSSNRFGPAGSLDMGDDEIRGRRRGFRVWYDAGYDPVPADLQDATAEAVKAWIERKAASSAILSERTDTWSVTYRDFIHALPPAVADVLAYYRDHAR